MVLFKKATDLYKYLDAQRKDGKKTGFVPTMGALHEGHISLIKASTTTNDISVCSIFVNPTQFNDPKDFAKYPITIEKDIFMLEKAGCDVLFLPSAEEIYPATFAKQHYELGYIESILEGRYRPGHFQGVCMVVHRLLDMVKPDNLYLGQKDYQQCMVIAKLIELTSMTDRIKLNIAPTLREEDGLAMSSRNMRLSEEERKKAAAIYQSLRFIKSNLKTGNLSHLKSEVTDQLATKGFKVDYVEICDAKDLSIADEWDGYQKLVVLIAAFNNEVRLIDNMLLNTEVKS
jgi:pantoate--beta-alanine ligase